MKDKKTEDLKTKETMKSERNLWFQISFFYKWQRGDNSQNLNNVCKLTNRIIF